MMMAPAGVKESEDLVPWMPGPFSTGFEPNSATFLITRYFKRVATKKEEKF